jgi:hypothetical protein
MCVVTFGGYESYSAPKSILDKFLYLCCCFSFPHFQVGSNNEYQLEIIFTIFGRLKQSNMVLLFLLSKMQLFMRLFQMQLTSYVNEFSEENCLFVASILDRLFRRSHAIETPQTKPVRNIELITLDTAPTRNSAITPTHNTRHFLLFRCGLCLPCG